MWNSSVGKRKIIQGIIVCLVSAVLSTMWWSRSFQTVSRGQLHNESCERETMRTGPSRPQEMAIQAHQALRRHYSCFVISCRSSGLLSSELSQSDYSAVSNEGSKWVLHTLARPNQSFVCNFLSTPRCKSQVPVKETKCLSCFGRDFWDMLTPIHVISNGDTKVFCRLNIFQSLIV